MDYNEFSNSIKKKYPQYAEMDNKELAQKMIEKYPQYKEQVTFNSEPVRPKSKGNPIGNFTQGFVHGLTDLPTAIAFEGANAIRPLLGKEKLTREEANKRLAQNAVYGYANKKPETIGGKIGDFAGQLLPALALPEVKIAQAPKAVNLLATGAYQGGLIGGAESFKNKGDLSGVLPGAVTGGVIAPAVPYAGKAIKEGVKLLPKAGGGVAKTLGRLQPETLQRAVQPNSKALDLTPEQAQNLLMNTTERVRGDYKALLNQKGNTVGNLLKELPEEVKIKADDLSNLYDSIYNSYSLSGNKELNPALNATSKELGKIKDMIYQQDKNAVADSLQKKQFDIIQKSNPMLDDYHTGIRSIDDILTPEQAFNKETFSGTPDWTLADSQKAMKDGYINLYSSKQFEPGIFASPSKMEAQNYAGKGKLFEKRVPINDYAPIDSIEGQYAPVNNLGNEITRTPKELYDINKNIANMINWDMPGTQTKNDVLEQIYLANAKKISNLSPALKQANKEYSDLMDFQKNEGIRRILNNQNNIDTASSALKNYNSTVTKGNTNRNIQDLEKILTDEGYSPFLNEIDDVNAAMDLNNIRTTGDSFWANLGTAAARPLLKAARKYNASGIPASVDKGIKGLRKLRSVQKRVLPEVPVTVIGTSPLLYPEEY